MAVLMRLKRLVWLALSGVCLFVPAGTVAWPGAWLFLGLFIGGIVVTGGWLKHHDPALFAQRTRPFRQPDQPAWDKAIGLGIAIVWYAFLLLMGFDNRWSGGPLTPVWLMASGAALMVAAFGLTAASFKANTFAETVVRLQTDRGQTVVDTGPYAVVRHPIYSASILVHSATVIMLGAWRGLYLLPALVMLLGLRAVLEERTLRQGLAGYDAYAARVRWRLVPFIW